MNRSTNLRRTFSAPTCLPLSVLLLSAMLSLVGCTKTTPPAKETTSQPGTPENKLSNAAVPSSSETPPTPTVQKPSSAPASKDAPAPAAISTEMAVDLAKKLASAKTTDPQNIAWGEPEVTKNDDGSFSISGVFTADGVSHPFACRVRLVESNGKREWQATDLKVDGN